jgi:hypothetical protein
MAGCFGRQFTFKMDGTRNDHQPLPPSGSGLSGLFPLGLYQGYPFHPKKSYGSGTEALSVEKELGNFKYQESLFEQFQIDGIYLLQLK